MKIVDLVNLDYDVLDLIKEIKCSKKAINDLSARCGAIFYGQGQVVYKGIPISVDESILILDECTLVYKTKENYFPKNTMITFNLNIDSSNFNIEQIIDSINKYIKFKVSN